MGELDAIKTSQWFKSKGYYLGISYLYWRTQNDIINHEVSGSKKKDTYNWTYAYIYENELKTSLMPAVMLWISCTLRLSRKTPYMRTQNTAVSKIDVDLTLTNKDRRLCIAQISSADVGRQITVKGCETITVDLGVYLLGYLGPISVKESLPLFTTIHEWISGEYGCYIDNITIGRHQATGIPGSLYAVYKQNMFYFPTDTTYGSEEITNDAHIQGQYGTYTIRAAINLKVSLVPNNTLAIKLTICQDNVLQATSAELTAIHICDVNLTALKLYPVSIIQGETMMFSDSPLDSDRMFTIECVFVAGEPISPGNHLLMAEYQSPNANLGGNVSCTVRSQLGVICNYGIGNSSFFNN